MADKEPLGGILVLEAGDLAQAIELMSNRPRVKAGPFEMRPATDLIEMIGDSNPRRLKKAGELEMSGK